jgi:diguanylate cyclase (GGDEF)-like protein
VAAAPKVIVVDWQEEKRHDALAMLDAEKVALNIGRLLFAGTGLALAWLLLAATSGPDGLAAVAFGLAAVGFIVWQRLAPTAEVRTLIELGLYGGAVLVIGTAALTGRDGAPILLFAIWLVPWAFIAWSKRRAGAYVAVMASACAALLAIHGSGGVEGFLRGQLPVLLIGMGGLVAVGVVIRMVVDHLIVSHNATVAAAAASVAAERERRERAGYDELTGLPGRERFAAQLTDALGDQDHDGVAVLLVDVDDFVLVNDTLGTTAGDTLLCGVAERLQRAVGGRGTVARLGADEFGILSPGSARELLAVDLAKRIQTGLRQPFELGETGHHASVSIGIAVAAADGEAHGLMRDAHLAQRHARARGRGRYELFDSGLRQVLEQRRSTEQELRGALERGEFRLLYQPLVDLASGRIRGAEALLRWQHPTRGLTSPGDFIGVAEATDLIIPIGAWALRHGLRQLKAWEQSVADLDDFRLSINLSGRQLCDGRFVPLLRRQLAKYAVDPHRLTCELTETALTDESPQVESAVEQIKALGVGLALDDFGTGYASLRYVRRFTFDSLKLDRSFVAGLGVDDDDTALVAAAVSMGKALNMTVVAEGVESQDQAQRLEAMGCKLAQGYLFGRPMEAAKLRALLLQQAARSVLDAAEPAEPAETRLRQHNPNMGPAARLARELEGSPQGFDPLAR